MSQERLDNKELLEQYLLGLTNPEQTAHVERLMDEHPELRTELEGMQDRMQVYLEEQGLDEESPSGNTRNIQDFHDLDHEMITAMTKRNHNLVIWRLALSAVCLILLFVSGYLFRENQNFRMEVNREKALHAQDEASAQRRIQALQGKTVAWDSLHTQTVASELGDVLIHYLTDNKVTFLDLSHLGELPPDEAYHLETKQGSGEEVVTLIQDSLKMSLIPIVQDVEHIKIWRVAAGTIAQHEKVDPSLIADFPIIRDAQKSSAD